MKAGAREKVEVVHREPLIITPRSREAAQARPIRCLWDERGWTVRDSGRRRIFEGPFHGQLRRTGARLLFAGRVELGGGATAAFVHHPPRELVSEHPKAGCFSSVGSDWYRMHWYRPTADVDETIAYVEKLLDEALNRSWR